MKLRREEIILVLLAKETSKNSFTLFLVTRESPEESILRSFSSRGLHGLDPWAGASCVIFNKAKGWVLHLPHKNSTTGFGQSGLRGVTLREQKGTWGSWLPSTEHNPGCAWVAKKANLGIGLIPS